MALPLTVDAWPPVSIRTARLVVRAPVAGDREAFVDLAADAEVNRYLGGARERAVVSASMPEVPADRPGRGEPVVLCTQTANTASVALAERLGFTLVETFEEFGAEQWFGVRR